MVYCNDCDRDITLDNYSGLFHLDVEEVANKHHKETGHEIVWERSEYHLIKRKEPSNE